MKFAIYDNGVFVCEKDIPEKPVLNGKPWRKFYTVEIVRPQGEIVDGPSIEEDHKAEIRRYIYTARNKTNDKLATEKENRVENIDSVIIKFLMNHENRLRALEGKQAISSTQFRNAIKDML